MGELLNLKPDKATFISCDHERQVKVTNTSNVTLYYKNASSITISSNDGSLTQGTSATFEAGEYFLPAANCQVYVDYLAGPTFQDFTVTDDLIVTDSSTLTGGITTTTPRTRWASTPAVVGTTDGTNSTPDIATVYLTELFIPVNCTLTGGAVFNGSSSATGKAIYALFNSAGAVLKTTALAGTAGSGTDAWQEINFTATVAVKGPNTFWFGFYCDTATAGRINLIPTGALGLNQAGLVGSNVLQTFGTVAAITPPSTQTADKGVYCYVY